MTPHTYLLLAVADFLFPKRTLITMMKTTKFAHSISSRGSRNAAILALWSNQHLRNVDYLTNYNYNLMEPSIYKCQKFEQKDTYLLRL